MTLGQAHRFGGALPATLAIMAVLWPGELPVVGWLAAPVPIAAAFVQRSRSRVAPPWVGAVVGLSGFGLGASLMIQNGLESLVAAGTLTLVTVLCGRIVTRENPDHDRQAILLALLLVFAATVIHTELSFAPLFVAFSISAVWALTARQLVVGAHDEAARGGTRLPVSLNRRDLATPAFMAVTATVAVLLLASTIVLFVVFPRIGLGNLGFVKRSRGDLPQSVSLIGSPRGALGGGEVVARVRGLTEADFDGGLYLRGPVYAQVNRDGFARGEVELTTPLETEFAVGASRSYEVFLQPVVGRSLFSLGKVEEVGILAGGTSNPGRRVRSFHLPSVPELRAAEPLTGPVRYQVKGSVLRAGQVSGGGVPTELSADETKKLSHYMQIPEELDSRIEPLTRQVTGPASSEAEKAAALRSFLRDGFAYTLEQPNGRKADPLAGFLLEDRRGHCEYFATAFAVMLRLSGVPARVVGGFQGGWLDEDGDIVVFTTDNAHAWVEWFDPSTGWVVDDATPPAPPSRLSGLAVLMERLRRGWDDWVVEYNLVSQLELAERIGRAVTGRSSGRDLRGLVRRAAVAVGVLVAVGLAALWIRRLLASSRRREDRLAGAIVRAVERLGGEPVSGSKTLREAVTPLAAAGRAQILARALEVYEQGRFADRPSSAPVVDRLVRDLERVA